MRSALRDARAAAPQPVSAAEVQFPIPNKTLYGADRTVSGHFYTAAKVRTYGDAREAAGYAAGVAAGGKDAERYRAALIKLSCLGNGDRPGNSEGNEIAIAALRGEVKP
jgi:hypothetical protein